MLANWVKCTTTTTGTGDLTLTPVSGFPSFADVFSIGQIVAYSIVNGSGEPVEEGIGSYSAADTLTRTYPCATYSGGVYDSSAPSTISLSGTYTVIASSVRGMAPTLPRMNTGAAARYWFTPSLVMSSAAARSLYVGNLYAEPVYFNAASPVDALALNVTTSGAAAIARIGIYSVGVDGKPGKLIKESGDLDCSSTGVKVSTFTAISLTPGWYYLCVAVKGAPVGVRCFAAGNASNAAAPTPLGLSSFEIAYSVAEVAFTLTTGLPTSPTGFAFKPIATDYVPMIGMRLV